MAPPQEMVPASLGHWLAGFVDAEGSFIVSDNGRSRGHDYHQCSFSIVLRQDQLPTLSLIQQFTGLGNIQPYLCRKQANPNASWCLSSRRDCLTFARLLQKYPLRAKKQRDFALWSRAVHAWTQERPERWSIMSEIKAELQTLRRYQSDLVLPLSSDPGFEHWLGGFIDGEGSFFVRARRKRKIPNWACAFGLSLRADDTSILREIIRRTGLGRLAPVAGSKVSTPKVIWQVDTKHQVALLRDLIAPLHLFTSKRLEFEVWSDAIDYWHSRQGPSQGGYGRPFGESPASLFDWTPMAAAAQEIHHLRVFQPAGDYCPPIGTA